MAVNSWSHSKLMDFEKCKKYFWLKHDQRIPEPERPLPPGKTEHANDRGTRVHQSCEDFVTGKTHELCPEADQHFGFHLDLLRTMYKDGLVSLEGEWGHNRDWEPWAWSGDWLEIEEPAELGLPSKKVKTLPARAAPETIYLVGKKAFIWEPPWLRLKLDAMVMHDETTATVIDYKTGRKFGNEVKHGEQLQLYQLATFMRYPKLQTVYAELWYLDQNEITSQRFSRTMGLRYRDKFTKRGDALTACEDFPAAANIHACRWCQYGPWNGGQCAEGVRAPSKPGKKGA